MKFYTNKILRYINNRSILFFSITSLLIHILFLNIYFDYKDFDNNIKQELEVVLVNSKSDLDPYRAEFIAQENLNSGGNIKKEEISSSMLPNINSVKTSQIEISAKRIKELEEHTKSLIELSKNISLSDKKSITTKNSNLENHKNLLENDYEDTNIVELRTKIENDWNSYQKLPKRKFIGITAKKAHYAKYVENWKLHIEEVGTKNFPKSTLQYENLKSLIVTVSIKSDGFLESVEIEKSSGIKTLDNATIKIVKLAHPFMPFPKEMTKETDIISITRNWTFINHNIKLNR